MDPIACKYELVQTRVGPRHVWSIVDHTGGLHAWITENVVGDPTYQGGLECHYRSPPDYMKDDPPSQVSCWLLQAPCWHDGSSLWAQEVLIPRWLRDPSDFGAILVDLKYDFISRFHGPTE